MFRFIYIFIILFILQACGNEMPEVKTGDNEIENIQFKDRLLASGDFDGDGILDTLRECYVNRKTGKEIHKIDFAQCGTQECVDGFLQKQQPGSYLLWAEKMDTLFLSFGETGYPTFGIDGVSNVGNIDKNPGDELAIVTGWADHSMNTHCDFWSYYAGQWSILKTFTIHEDQIYDAENQKVILMKTAQPDLDEKQFLEATSKGIIFRNESTVFYYSYEPDGSIKENRLNL